ncbi:hypothetical protein, partial [Neglectibacter timonensis]
EEFSLPEQQVPAPSKQPEPPAQAPAVPPAAPEAKPRQPEQKQPSFDTDEILREILHSGEDGKKD